MYCVQFCYEGYSKVVAIFDDRGLASEYALFKKQSSLINLVLLKF